MPRLPPAALAEPFSAELKDSNRYYRLFLHEDVNDATEDGIWFFDWIEQTAGFWGSNWDAYGVGDLDGKFSDFPSPDGPSIRHLPEVPGAISGVPPLVAFFDQRFNRDRLLPSYGMGGITDYNDPSKLGVYDFSEKDTRYGPGMFLEKDFGGSLKFQVPQWFPGQNPYNGTSQNGQKTDNYNGPHLNFFKTVTPISQARYNYRGDFAALLVFKLDSVGQNQGLFSYESYSDDTGDTGDDTRHYALWVNSGGYFHYGHSWYNGSASGTPMDFQESLSQGATPLVAGKTYYLLFIRKHGQVGEKHWKTGADRGDDHRFIIYLFDDIQVRTMSNAGRLGARVNGTLADPAWKPRSITDYDTDPNGNKITNNTAWQSPNAEDIVNSDQNLESDRAGLYLGFARNDIYYRGSVKHFRLYAGPQIYNTDAVRKEFFGPPRLEEPEEFRVGPIPIPEYFDPTFYTGAEEVMFGPERYLAYEELLLAAIRPKKGKDGLWYPVPQLGSLSWTKGFNSLGNLSANVNTQKLLKYVGPGANLGGSGPPSGGFNGDVYYDTSAGSFYKKTSGSWALSNNPHPLGLGTGKLTDLFGISRPFRVVARDEQEA